MRDVVAPASPTVVVERHHGDDGAWDAFVASAPGGSFCHLAGWRGVMQDVLGHEWLPLVARDAHGKLAGVLPLVHVRSRLTGHALVSMPFLNYGGPAGDAVATRALIDASGEEARRSGAALLELRTRDEHVSPFDVSRHKITVLLDLPATPELLWKQFPSKLRSQIRKPTKEGLVARLGEDQLDAFYAVFARNMRDLGTPVLPRAFFARIRDAFRDHVVFAAVYDGVTPVAGGCGFVFGDEFEITWASSLREHNAKSPNMLLYCAMMEAVIARGVRIFNFGRCTPGGPTHRFKQQWGGRDVPLPWQRWTRSGEQPSPAADRPLFQLATTVWQRLPLSITNALGPALVRHLP